MNIDDFEGKYKRQQLKELQDIVNGYISKDQDLRTTLDLVQLIRNRKNPEEPTTTTKNQFDQQHYYNCISLMKQVSSDYGKIYNLSVPELEALTRFAGVQHGPIHKAIERRLIKMKQLGSARSYLQSRKLHETVEALQEIRLGHGQSSENWKTHRRSNSG